MFAISYALIICNVLSCIPSLPAVIFTVDGDKFHASMVRFFDKMPNEMDQPLLKLLMKFQFGGLTFLYLLGAFAGYFCPTVIIGYMFAGGNFARVAFLLIKMADSEKWAGRVNQDGQPISSADSSSSSSPTVLPLDEDAEYQAYAASMAADAEAKWGTDYGTWSSSLSSASSPSRPPGLLRPLRHQGHDRRVEANGQAGEHRIEFARASSSSPS